MTRNHERVIFWTVAAICAATRFLAMAPTLWEWDEVLFSKAMQDFDVARHQPHPPGFPVYIAAAKLLRLLIDSDFRALQAVNLIAGVLLFPAMFALARELGFRFSTAIIASALLAFFPNVWFFGGGAFSDIPSLTLILFALMFLFRGWRSRAAYWGGTLLLALATGIRPQNLVIGLFAGGVATKIRGRQSWRDVAVALLIGVTVVAAAFGGAMMAGESPKSFVSAVRAHSDYITHVDSFRSPDRPPMWRLFDRFFIKQYQSPLLSIIISIFVLISAIGSSRERNRSIGYVAASFAPFAVLAWMMLDRYSISRFSIGYAPMFAFLAADGIARVARRNPRAEWVVGSLLIGAFIAYTLPALTVVRSEVTPPVQALRAVQKTMDPARDELFVGFTMPAFVDYFTPDIPYVVVHDDRAVPLSAGGKRAFLLAEAADTRPSGFSFQRERTALWNIARRHYFEIVFKPLSDLPKFLSGWHRPERSGHEEWRWMTGNSVTELPPTSGETLLAMQMSVPSELFAQKPTVVVTLNGKVLERFSPATPAFTRNYVVEPRPGAVPNTLELSIDRTVWDAGSGREYGLRLRWLSWGPR